MNVEKFGMFLVLLLLFAKSVLNSNTVEVSPRTCPDCTRIGDALNAISSNTTLQLLSGGNHVLDEFILVHDLSSIAIVGNDSSVTITCIKNVGLTFVRILNLTIEHIIIQQCGLSGENLQNAINVMEGSIAIFFHVPFPLQVGLLLGDITHAHFTGVTISSTSGIGLLGINIVGTSSFVQVNLFNNTYTDNCSILLVPEILFEQYKKQIGGGAFILYHDYWSSPSFNAHLTFHNSSFIENRDCSITGSVARRMQFSETLRTLGYTVGAGGGLSVVLAQREYSANVTVDSCLFDGNLAVYGAGAHVSLFADIRNGEVVFSNCTFTGNGGPNSTDGGGIAILGNLIWPLEVSYWLNSSFWDGVPGKINFQVIDSRFINNTAFSGGGVFSLFLHSFHTNHLISLTYSNCIFQNNSATYGAAILAYEHGIAIASLYSTPSGIHVRASNIFVDSNSLVSPVRSGIIDILYVYFTLCGNSTLQYNYGTSLRARRSMVHISDHATFHSNYGIYGGAFSLVAYSILVIHRNTTVVCSNNAAYRGGVFHVDLIDTPIYIQFDCFLFLGTYDRFCNNCSDISELGITLTFYNNFAQYGNLVYGSTLNTCPWGDMLKTAYSSNYTGNLWELLATSEETQNTFHFTRKPVGVRSVTTPSEGLIIENDSFIVAPGQLFSVQMHATDKLNQITPATITSGVLPEDIHILANITENFTSLMTESRLGASNHYALESNEVSTIPTKLFGEQETLVRVSIFSVGTDAIADIKVYLKGCNSVFYYSAEERACICRPQLELNGIHCDDSTHELVVPSHLWIGLLGCQNESEPIIVIEACILDYCEPGQRRVVSDGFDKQCTQGYNRTGLLCGSCREGYSIVLGTRRCRKCTNNAYLALILVFAVAGILLIALVAFLKVSVSEGYLNGLIFFSHNISPYIFILAPRAPSIFIPVAFLNLNLGIETCFYDGMNALAYAGLQFVFPFYLYLLMAIIILLARCIKCPFDFGFSAGKTFATLLVLTYTSIGRTCFEILRPVVVKSVTNSMRSIRWGVDPSVFYFHGWHAVLGTISISLFFVYLIPLLLLLLFPSKAYGFKFSVKMKPILDAYFAPYKPKFRCWIGIRLLTGIILSVVFLLMRFPSNVFTATLVLIAFTFVQTQIRPYIGTCLNTVDTFLLVDMSILLVGALFFSIQSYLYGNGLDNPLLFLTKFSAGFLSLAYVIFIGVLFYHIFLRLPERARGYLKWYFKFSNIKTKLTDFLKSPSPNRDHSCEYIDINTQSAEYHRMEENPVNEKETQFEAGQAIVEAPEYAEGTAQVIPVT